MVVPPSILGSDREETIDASVRLPCLMRVVKQQPNVSSCDGQGIHSSCGLLCIGGRRSQNRNHGNAPAGAHSTDRLPWYPLFGWTRSTDLLVCRCKAGGVTPARRMIKLSDAHMPNKNTWKKRTKEDGDLSFVVCSGFWLFYRPAISHFMQIVKRRQLVNDWLGVRMSRYLAAGIVIIS